MLIEEERPTIMGSLETYIEETQECLQEIIKA